MAAATDTKQLLLQVDASIELLRRGMAEGGGVVDKFDREARRTLDRFDGRMSKVGAGGMPVLKKNLEGVRSSLSGLAASLGLLSVGASAKTFLDLADQSKQMRAQLTLATADFGTFAQGQADVERIAATTRVGLQATTALYGTLLRASQPLGKSQTDAARASETFAKALKIGGADANAAASATLQFSQALASGVLRGDEFNSIAEASPRILKLLADAMGVPQGQLRALAAEGKLTSDKLYDALTNRKFTGGIDAEFAKLPVTFAESMTLVHDAAVISFGAFDRGGDFSNAIVSFVGDGSDGFKSLSGQAEQFGADTRAVFAGLANVFDPIEVGGNAVFDALGIKVFSVGEQIRSLLGSFDRVGSFAAGVANVINAPGNAARWLAGKPTTMVYGSNLEGRYVAGERTSAARSRREASARRLEERGFNVPRNKDGTINEAGITRRTVAPRIAVAPTAQGNADVAKYQKQIADLERLKASASGKELATLQAQIDRRQRIVSSLQKGVGLEAARAAAGGAGGGGSAVSEAKKKAREAQQAADKTLREDRRYAGLLASEDDKTLSGQAALATSVAERLAIERQRRQTAVDAHLEEIRTDKALSGPRKAELSAAVQRNADLEEQRAERDRQADLLDQRAQTDRANLQQSLDMLGIEADLATTVRQRRDVSLRILEAQEALERQAQEAILNDPNKSPAEKQRATSAIAGIAAQHDGRVESINQGNASPIEAYRTKLKAAAGDMGEALEGVEANGLESLENGLLGIVTGTESVGSAFKKMASSIISDLARIAIQRAILSAIGGGLFGYAEGGPLSKIPGRAEGGSLGGMISGPGNGKSDSILALLKGPGGGAVRLSNREFIMNEGAVNYYGPATMAALNSKRLPRFATGGSLGGQSVPSLRAPSLPNLTGLAGGRRDRVQVDGNISVTPTKQFHAEMASLSFQTVSAAADPIMAGAEGRTLTRLRRPGLPGAPG